MHMVPKVLVAYILLLLVYTRQLAVAVVAVCHLMRHVLTSR